MEIRNIFGTKFRGSLDKTFTAVERKSGKNYMRRYVKPDDPQTEVQVRHRALFTKGADMWKVLHPAQQLFYNGIAQHMTGFNLLLKRFIRAHSEGLDGFDLPVVLVGTPVDGSDEDGCFLAVQTEHKLLFQRHLLEGDFDVAMSLEDAPYEIVLRRGSQEEVVLTVDDVLSLDVPMTVESEKLGLKVVLDVPEDISPPDDQDGS